jgi:hypothetical protein
VSEQDSGKQFVAYLLYNKFGDILVIYPAYPKSIYTIINYFTSFTKERKGFPSILLH